MSDYLTVLLIGGFFVAIWVRFLWNIFALRSFKRDVDQFLRQNRPTMALLVGNMDTLTVRERGAVYAIGWEDLRKLKQNRSDLGQAIEYWLSQPPQQAIAATNTMPSSNQSTSTEKPLEEVSLDRVEMKTPQLSAVHCEKCKRYSLKVYYEVNGKINCETCVETRKRDLASRTPTKRFIRATLWGSGVGLICTFIYYGISALTGFEFGLIAIVVGLAVGLAVRHGSDERGGWVYQGLAMFLTYTAIALTYSPVIGRELVNLGKKQDAAPIQAAATAQSPTTQKGGSSKEQNRAVAPSKPSAPVDQKQTIAKPDAKNAAPQITGESNSSKDAARAPVKNNPHTHGASSAQRITVGQFFLGTTVILALFWLAPFLSGMRNMMGLLIIGFAVYEAWKINKKGDAIIRGPYTVQAQPTSQSATS